MSVGWMLPMPSHGLQPRQPMSSGGPLLTGVLIILAHWTRLGLRSQRSGQFYPAKGQPIDKIKNTISLWITRTTHHNSSKLFHPYSTDSVIYRWFGVFIISIHTPFLI